MANTNGRVARGKGAFGTRVVGVKLPSLCVAPAAYEGGRDKPVRAVIFIPHSTYLEGGFDIGGYTATVAIPARAAASLASDKQVVIPFDRADSLTLAREGSPRITLDPLELSHALRDRRDRFADAVARRSKRASGQSDAQASPQRRQAGSGFSPARAPADARGRGGQAS